MFAFINQLKEEGDRKDWRKRDATQQRSQAGFRLQLHASATRTPPAVPFGHALFHS